MSTSIPTLHYSTLPPGSTLTIRHEPNLTTLLAPAGDIVPSAKRPAQIRAAILAGAVVAGVILAGWFVYAKFDLRRLPSTHFFVALGCFIVFLAALFLFVWRARVALAVEVLREAYEQQTALALDDQFLRIESAGPLGNASRDIPRDQIESIRLDTRAARSQRGVNDHLPCITLDVRDGQPIYLLLGRDVAELRWVTGHLRQQLSLPEKTDSIASR